MNGYLCKKYMFSAQVIGYPFAYKKYSNLFEACQEF